MNKEKKTAFEQLNDRLATLSDLRSVKSLLFWDQQTYMPAGAVAGRAEQVATMSRLAHEMLVDGETKRLMDTSGEPDPSSEEGALLRRALRDYERATKLPAELVAQISRVTAVAEAAWVRARKESDWQLFAPHLVHHQDRFWAMSCSAACEVAERSRKIFRQCSGSSSLHCPEGSLIMH